MKEITYDKNGKMLVIDSESESSVEWLIFTFGAIIDFITGIIETWKKKN